MAYASLVSPKLTTIRRLPAFEANLAAGKLEAEGIQSFVADQNISVAHPLLFNEVRLQVREVDVELAEQILSTPVTAHRDREDDDEDDENAEDEDDYVAEAYRCPRCHRKEVDLVPFSQPTRVLRTICVLVIIAPIANALLGIAIPDLNLLTMVPVPTLAMVIAWMLALCFLIAITMLASRRKRCRQCGFEWSHDSGG